MYGVAHWGTLRNVFPEIQSTDLLNKQSPDSDVKAKLGQLHVEFRALLLDTFEKQQKYLKITFYTSGNKASKFLVHLTKGRRLKSHINPQAIADLL